jgi:hypothetical protein
LQQNFSEALVVHETLQTLIDEINDPENDLRLQRANFPPVGCDRRAPPAKVGINLFQSKLEIVAYNGDEAEGNKIELDWSVVTEFCSQKDGLAIKYKRKESEKSLKVFLVQSEIAVDFFSRIQLEKKVEEQLDSQPLPESVLRLLSS